jgi:hypothetical protein
MELFLNILWMLIAAVLLGTWRTRWIHQRRRTLRHSVQEWSAVSVALVLLFFAVSMSDDMHSEIVALEDCSASKRELVCALASHPLPPSGVAAQAPSWAIVPRVPSCTLLTALHNIELVGQVRTSYLPSNGPSDRAPPAFL